jgi:hypothetical protein
MRAKSVYQRTQDILNNATLKANRELQITALVNDWSTLEYKSKLDYRGQCIEECQAFQVIADAHETEDRDILAEAARRTANVWADRADIKKPY